MRCNVLDPETQTKLLNVRHIDEVGEELGWSDDEIDAAEKQLKENGRYWAMSKGQAVYYLVPVR